MTERPDVLPQVPAPRQADALSDVLRAVRLTGATFFLWDVSWPFTMPVPDGATIAPILLPGAQQLASYHVVTEGTCFASLPGELPLRLEAGDILLVPKGASYVMASSAQACQRARLDLAAALPFYEAMAAGELPFVIEDGGGGPGITHVVCGFLGCDLAPFNPLLGSLPGLVRVPPPRNADDALSALLRLAVEESRQPRPGGHTVLQRLSELLFVEVLRRCSREVPAEGWLAGLRHPAVGRALAQIHASPALAWTLDRLAKAAGTSRSRLAEAFSATVGRPPMQYLARWRMQLAARALADHDATVAAVASDVGYASEAAFSRAFKRIVGVSPRQWRRLARSEEVVQAQE